MSESGKGNLQKKVIRQYYWFQFTFTLLFWTPIFFEYHLAMGLNEAQVFRIQSLYYVVFCLLELPTGYFADRFGYLRSMVLGSLTLVVANLLAIGATHYWGFVAHWILIALARSFVSGASSAYLYEYLRQNAAHKEFKQIEGNARAYSLMGRILCFAIVGVLMQWKMNLPYWLTALSAVVSIVFVRGLPQIATPMRKKKLLLRTGFAHAMGSPYLLLLMFQGIVIFVLGRMVSVNLFQPILKSKDFTLEAFGLVMGVMTFFEAIGSARPVWMRRYFRDLHSIFILSVGLALSVALIPGVAQWGTVVLLCVFSVAAGLSYPIQKQVMNEAIPDPEYRATILSLESLIDRAVTAGVALILEQTIDRMDQVLIWTGVISVVLMLIVQFGLVAVERRSSSMLTGKDE